MNLRLLLASSALSLSLVACGGGGSTPSPLASATPGAAVTSTLPQSAANVPTTLPASALPANTGVSSATYTLPFAIPAGATLAASATAPSSIAAFDAAGPVAQGLRSGEATDASAKAILFLALQSPITASLNGNYAISFNLTSAPSSAVTYHIAAFNGSSWNYDAAGTGTTGVNSVVFQGTFPTGAALSLGTTYAIALYTVNSGVAIPTPTPFVSASPTPTTAPLSTSGTLVTTTSAQQLSGTILGDSVTLNLPAANSSVAVPYSITTVAPTGISQPPSHSNYYAFLQFTPAATVVVPGNSQITATVTSATSVLPVGSYKFAAYNNGNWADSLGQGSVTVTNGVASLSYTTPGDFTFTSGTTYYLALYQ